MQATRWADCWCMPDVMLEQWLATPAVDLILKTWFGTVSVRLMLLHPIRRMVDPYSNSAAATDLLSVVRTVEVAVDAGYWW
jgi:hypothetical protein